MVCKMAHIIKKDRFSSKNDLNQKQKSFFSNISLRLAHISY